MLLLHRSITEQLGVCPSCLDNQAEVEVPSAPSDHLYRLPVDHPRALHISRLSHDQKKHKTTPKTNNIFLVTMDPFSAEGELVNIHTAFIQGQYQLVLSDFDASDFSESNRLPVQVLQYRAQCELGQASEVLSAVSSAQASSTPDLAAVRIYASFVSKGAQDEKAVAEAEKLSDAQGDNLTVQLLCGTILARAGKQEQALQLLAKHQGSLDAVALIVQIHLSQNRTDLAVKEAKGARSFAQDALLVNLAESWIGIRQVCLF
jgi:coatomer protein complex subunit epsilon